MNEIHIDLKDLPSWVKEILKEKGKRPRSIPVRIGATVRVGGHDMATLYIYNGSEVTELKGAITYNPWATHIENAIATGGEVTIPRPECMIFEEHHFAGRPFFVLYTHPASVIKALMEPSELTNVQKAVLLATRIYKPNYGTIKDYRFHEMSSRFKISREEWDEAKANLTQNVYLDKRGAIKTKGLNAIRGLDLHHLDELFRSS